MIWYFISMRFILIFVKVQANLGLCCSVTLFSTQNIYAYAHVYPPYTFILTWMVKSGELSHVYEDSCFTSHSRLFTSLLSSRISRSEDSTILVQAWVKGMMVTIDQSLGGIQSWSHMAIWYFAWLFGDGSELWVAMAWERESKWSS